MEFINTKIITMVTEQGMENGGEKRNVSGGGTQRASTISIMLYYLRWVVDTQGFCLLIFYSL